jgi:hypothetical protein
MKKVLLPVIAALLLPAAAQTGQAGAVKADPDSEKAALVKQAKKLLKGYAMTLKGTLTQEMKKNGPIAAIGVCSRKAQPIGRMFSRNGWTVGRTALKLRNVMQDAPDDWEKATLKMFEKKMAEGADPKTLVRAEIIKTDSGRMFRFMKAIPTGKPCLTCHGENIKPEIRKTIDANYPDDRATGFKLGDLRGAFTLKKTLDN